ncbi:MAG TPA: GAF domain-containing protein, partial [Candidatus Binatia bacterium]|nr:GAF domain-containing protein [Candidatus Binatia bacterium]
MATISKKTAKNPKAKTASSLPKEPRPKQAQATEALRRERDEALEQLAAASDILRMIARSPTDIQPVLDAVAASAARLCESYDVVIHRVDRGYLQRVAHFGPVPVAEERRPISRGGPIGRAIVDGQTIHVHDILAEIETEFPGAKGRQQISGTRTVLATPLLREGVSIGGIQLRRQEVRPFTDRQIKLLETFADQAVIAIENARLIHEQHALNRDLTEALEQQTATSEILGVISSSPSDLQPVFDTIARNAVDLCSALFGAVYRFDGEFLHLAAHHNYNPEVLALERRLYPMRPNREQAVGRAILGRAIVHMEDVLKDPDYRHEVATTGGWRSMIAVPMFREGAPVGVIWVARAQTGPFPDNQIALLKTFADQAVIAIENVRLFKELQDRNRQLTEALEQQTATSDILGVISSAPTDLQPVFDTIAKHSVKLCGALFSSVYRFDGELIHMVAHHNYPPIALERSLELFPTRPGRHLFTARAILDCSVINVPDVANDSEHTARDLAATAGFRSVLSVPMLRGSDPIGAITVWHGDVGPFSQTHVTLLQTFADQAVIAIENARLFHELQVRNRDLTEALEQQTATSEILGV